MQNAERSGAVNLSWESVTGAVTYAVETLVKGETAWQNGKYCTTKTLTLTTAAGKTIRELCSDAGVPVTRSVVPLTEAISRAFGSVPPGLSYMPLLGELLDEHLLVGAP